MGFVMVQGFIYEDLCF